MTWTCNNCGKNHGDETVESELRTTGEVVAGDGYYDSVEDDVVVPMEEVEGWECNYCGHFHPTPERAPGDLS